MADDGAPSKGGPPPKHLAATISQIADGPLGGLLTRVRELVGLGASARRQLDDQQASSGPAVGNSFGTAPGSPGERREPWFGPGQPMRPVAPREDVAGRAFDFPITFNMGSRPRQGETVGFAQLRALADNCDLVRLAIETRKDQLASLTWSIRPKKKLGQDERGRVDQVCEDLTKRLEKPDGLRSWDSWVRMLAEDLLVIDAPTIYKRRTLDGSPYSLDVIDGATIQVLLDKTGRRPSEGPAYTQILKGMTAIHYTADELYYAPRNPRSHKAYGFGPVEQIIGTVNLALRRMASQLAHFTDGNVPAALIGVPESWTTEQISSFQRYWDQLNTDQGQRRRAKFVPGGMNYQPTLGDAQLTDQFDEWIARLVCYAFSLPPMPFVKVMNRATAETAYDAALAEGLQPLMQWLKTLVDNVIQEFFGQPDYEFLWDDIRKLDPAEQKSMDLQDIRAGILSIDEARIRAGQEPLGLPHIIFGLGPLGFMSVDAVKAAIDQGLDRPQPAPQPMQLGPDGQPIGGDPFAGASPDMLGSLGIPNSQSGEDPYAQAAPAAPDPAGAPASPRFQIVASSPQEAATLRSAQVDPDALATLMRVRALDRRQASVGARR